MAGNAPPQIPGCRELSLIGERVARSLFSATSDRLGRAVTVIAYPPLSEGRTWADFDRAATTAQRLGVHPSMISIHEWGQADDGRPWIVTDPQPAEALDVALTLDGPLEVERALQVGVLLAGALETAHGAGIVHGDLSPSRLVLGPHGEPLMTETGLAAFAVFPGLGALNNPVRYHAPPEVLERTEITTATDVYSLASTVYALIAGRAPHEKPAEVTDSNASLLLRVLQIAVPQIDRPGVPPWVVETLRGPLAPDPGKRPQQAIEVAWLLQDVQRRAGFAITEPVVLDLDDIEAQRSPRATGGAGGRSSWPAPASAEPPAPARSAALNSAGPWPEPAAPAVGGLWTPPPPASDPDPGAPAEVDDAADVPEPTIFPFEVADHEPPAVPTDGVRPPAAPEAPAHGASLWPSSWPSGGGPAGDLPTWARSTPPEDAPVSNGSDPVVLPTWSEPPPPPPANGSLPWSPAEPEAAAPPPDVVPTAEQPAWAPPAEPAPGLPGTRADRWRAPEPPERGADEPPATEALRQATAPPWTPAEPERPVLPRRGFDDPPTWAPPETAPTGQARPDLPRRGAPEPPTTGAPPETPAAPPEPARPDLPRRGAPDAPAANTAPWTPPEPTEPARPDLPRRGAPEPPTTGAPPQPAAGPTEPTRPELPTRGAPGAPAAHPPPWAPPQPAAGPTEPTWPDVPERGVDEAPAAEPPAWTPPAIRPELPKRGAAGAPEAGGGGDEVGDDAPWAPPRPFWETAPRPGAPAAEADHSTGNGSSYGVPRPPELDVLPAWYTDPLPNGRKSEPAAKRLPGAGDELRSLFGAVVGEPAAAPPPPLDLHRPQDPVGPPAEAPPARPAPSPGPGSSPTPEAPFRLPRPTESAYATEPPPVRRAEPPQARPAPPPPVADAPPPKPAAGPPALPIIVLVAVVVVLIAGVLWLVITGDDAATPASERPRGDAVAEAPTGLAVTLVPEGAQITWEGSAEDTYVVTVLSSTAPPQALPPAPGTSALVPSAGAPPGTLRCFTVARAPATNDGQPGTPTDPVCEAGATPEQMQPAP